jgi:hypothetical protein
MAMTFKERRMYVLVGAGVIIFVVLVAAGVPVSEIMGIITAFGVGGILKSPVSSTETVQ